MDLGQTNEKKRDKRYSFQEPVVGRKKIRTFTKTHRNCVCAQKPYTQFAKIKPSHNLSSGSGSLAINAMGLDTHFAHRKFGRSMDPSSSEELHAQNETSILDFRHSFGSMPPYKLHLVHSGGWPHVNSALVWLMTLDRSVCVCACRGLDSIRDEEYISRDDLKTRKYQVKRSEMRHFFGFEQFWTLPNRGYAWVGIRVCFSEEGVEWVRAFVEADGTGSWSALLFLDAIDSGLRFGRPLNWLDGKIFGPDLGHECYVMLSAVAAGDEACQMKENRPLACLPLAGNYREK